MTHTVRILMLVVTHAITLAYAAEPDPFDEIATIVEQGIADGEMPGAVVMVADSKDVLYARAFGQRQVEPHPEPMTLDTVFDMASITKPVATATSIMRLADQGKIAIDQPVAKYLPEFGRHGKSNITVEHLLLHVGGLIADNALRDYRDGPQKAWERVCELEPIATPGERFIYSDVGFIVLGKLVHQISGMRLDRYAKSEIFQPLDMRDTMFNPEASLRLRAAPTEKRDGRWLRGQVHDPRAALLDGVAGHAGLFSTADDLVRYGRMMLGSGRLDDAMVLSESGFQTMTRPRTVPRGTRTLGWDHRSPYSRNRGESFSDAAFGHGGFTGTVLWIDPQKDLVFVFLSNRLHPDGKGTVNGLAGQIATIVGNAR